MRILWLNHYAVPEGGSSGTRHAVLARFLVEMGHEVMVVASARPQGRRLTVEIPKNKRHLDKTEGVVQFRYVWTRPYSSSAGRLLSMLDYRREVLRSPWQAFVPDVVIGSSVHLHAADAGRVLARRFRVPFVFEVGDPWPEGLAELGVLPRFHPVYIYLAVLEQRCLRGATGVITLLPKYFEYLESKGVPKSRILYLPNGVEVSLFEHLPPPPPDPPFVVTYFGAHGVANALDTVVRAAALLNADNVPVRFYLVGDGPLKPSLVHLARSLGATNIVFRDPVPKTELASLVRDSHALVFHLRVVKTLESYGISPNKLFEYMAAGRPIIFACRSANNPVAEANGGISIEPEDPKAMADAVVRLMQMPAHERDAMGQRARTWVCANHDLRKLAVQLSRWLNDLCDRFRRTSQYFT